MVCTEGAKQMIREGHGGAICCVSSISAHVGAPGQTAYCGTKGAISMLAKALGCDLGAHGIRVNAVEPGWVMTPMSAPLMEDPAAVKYYNDRVALDFSGCRGPQFHAAGRSRTDRAAAHPHLQPIERRAAKNHVPSARKRRRGAGFADDVAAGP